jgi:glutamine amidotransferase
MKKVAIIDYGTGNLASIGNMLRKIGQESVITNNKAEIQNASFLILPGVGSFDTGMKNLKDAGLDEIIKEEVLGAGKPVLGICLGMQLLAGASEEGKMEGLGLIEGKVIRFVQPEGSRFKIPHMGWNEVVPHPESRLLKGYNRTPRFYFVHSFHLISDDPKAILSESSYGIKFNAVYEKENVMAVQFHPEKSHRFGIHLLRQFLSES